MRDYRSVIEEKLRALRGRASRLEALLAALDEIDREDGITAESPATVVESQVEEAPASAGAEDESLTDHLRRLAGGASRLQATGPLADEALRNRPGKRQSVYATLNRLKKAGDVDNIENKGWASPAVVERERRFMENRPKEVFDLADCAGWDIQHYKNHRVERAHLIALMLHVRAGTSERGGSGYTLAQADAVLQRLVRSIPTILEAVDAVLATGEIPEETRISSEDTTESRCQAASEGVRVARAQYGDEYRAIPWPEQASGRQIA